MSTPTNIALACLMSLVLASSYLLDGPSETDAARDTAASVADAQAAAKAAATREQFLPKAKTVTTAQVQP